MKIVNFIVGKRKIVLFQNQVTISNIMHFSISYTEKKTFLASVKPDLILWYTLQTFLQ